MQPGSCESDRPVERVGFPSIGGTHARAGAANARSKAFTVSSSGARRRYPAGMATRWPLHDKGAREVATFDVDRRWQRLRARGQVLRANTIDLVARSRRALDRSRALLRHSRRRMLREEG